MKHENIVFLFLSALLLLLLLPISVSAACECETESEERDATKSLKLKIIGIVVILIAGALGVVIPTLGEWLPFVRPERDAFFVIKAFAAGVILSTALIHVFPESFESLTSPCLNENPWHKFPFAGFVTMMSALVTLMIDCVATGYYKRKNSGKERVVDGGDVEEMDGHAGHLHVHAQAVNTPEDVESMSERLRHRVISQVLEIGIVVHSVIIGISLGASQSSETIKPIIAALCFHQFFEGLGLGSCITLAKFSGRTITIMVLFFSLTTPIGVGVGIGISTSYSEDSNTSLIIEGIFNAASAGILIYMSLVDLLAVDFMSSRMQRSGKLQLWAYSSLFLGAGLMSVIAKWN